MLLPGWGFDFKVFPLEGFSCNLLVPREPVPGDFPGLFPQVLEKFGIQEKVSVMGWSLGGHLAAKAARSHGDLIKKVLLVSVRKNYPEKMITDLKSQVLENRERALKKFYLSAFHPHKEAYRAFSKRHLPRLLRLWSKADLLKGLDLLLQHPIYPCDLGTVMVLVIHGRHDVVAPVEEMPALSSSAGIKTVILKNQGHLPFREPCFHEILDNF